MLQEFTKQVKTSITEQINGIHTCIPGTVISFDASKCEADITPLGKLKLPNGKFMNYPKLTGVPVMFPQFTDGGVFYPVKSGDGCLIVFSEYTLDTFRKLTESSNDYKFDLTNAVAIIGLFSKVDSRLVETANSENSVIIQNKTNLIKVKQDCIELQQNKTTILKVTQSGIEITGNITATGTIHGSNI